MDNQKTIETIRILNPYQYLGPLSKKEFFFDREEELQDAIVVCEQILGGVAGGVLVIGGRGSGKTSFIDALCRNLNERNIANVKIPLNQGLVTAGNEIVLFRTILSELFRATQQANLFEKGVLQNLMQFIDGAKVEVDQLGFEIPGISFIVKSAQSGAVEKIPYIVLRDGLNDFIQILDTKAKSGTRRGAIIIFDEGDVLTLNKDLLQILRNVFQGFPRIGLVVAGSTKLLAQVSEVFSPVPRFFRKIELGVYPNDYIVDKAIEFPLDYARKELSAKGINIAIVHGGFDSLVKIISGRMPMEINLLCYFAFDLGARRLKIDRDGKVTLFMKVDKSLMDETILQLRGTREYDSLINGFKDSEIIFLNLLSKSQAKATLDELTLLMVLNELGSKLQSMPYEEVIAIIHDFKKHKPDVQSIFELISAKGEKYGINIFTSSLTGMSLYDIEDQLLRSYFKYGWKYRDTDIELGMKPEFGGIRVFGDPIATVIHSTLFPRMADVLGGTDSFRANAYQNDGSSFRPAKGRLLVGISYLRVADGLIYHIVFQLKERADFRAWETEILALGKSMKEVGLIKSCRVFNKKHV